MKVLIVGAGGFIGGFIARESLSRGHETWCGVRESTSRRYLTDPQLHFITLDYDDPEKMASQMKGHHWDYIVYNLGATKCINFSDFNLINYSYLGNFCDALITNSQVPDRFVYMSGNFCDALITNSQVPDRFVYMSSLSAIGPGDEKNYTPLSDRSVPLPNTRYGVSKIKAETLLQTLPDFPWIILRPTGVYGPHEKDYLMMIKCIDSHFDFGVGFRKQMLTFVYVEDLARAIFDALEKAPVHKKYIISEPRAYSQKEFRRIVARELGRKFVIPVRLPLWALKIACSISEKYGVAKMKAVTLNSDKYNIMAQRNWSCDTSGAEHDFGFRAQTNLEEGIRRTVAAYRSEQENNSPK